MPCVEPSLLYHSHRFVVCNIAFQCILLTPISMLSNFDAILHYFNGVAVIHVIKNGVKNPTSKKQCVNKHFVILSNLLFTFFALLAFLVHMKTRKYFVKFQYYSFCNIFHHRLFPITKLFLFVALQAIQNRILRYLALLFIYFFMYIYYTANSALHQST